MIEPKPGAYKVEGFVHDPNHQTYFRVELNSPIYGRAAIALLGSDSEQTWVDFAHMGSGWDSYGAQEHTAAVELFAETLLGLLRGDMAIKPGTVSEGCPWVDHDLGESQQ